MADDISESFVDALDSFPTVETLTLDSPSNGLPLSVPSPPPPPPPTGLRRRHSSLRRNPSGVNRFDRDQTSVVTTTSASVESVADAQSAPPLRLRSSCLEYFAEFVIKAVFFQVNLLINCFAFPVRLLYWLLDPFGILKLVRNGLGRVWRRLVGKLCSPLYRRVGGQQGGKKLVSGVVLGCLWSFYVCVLLSALLALAFLAANVFMNLVTEEPVRITQELSFDYTKAKPDALVPVSYCTGVSASGEKVRVEDWERWRLVPPNHKLKVTVSLVLPESDYNKRLGVFQVRVEFLSAGRMVLSTSSQPCMLRFKSTHMYLIETFLRSVALLSGYASEAQIIRVKMTGFSEGTEPTACLRVILEQRAEFKFGAGIPEIYSASVKLESELPLFKQIIWNWRRTLLVWSTMVLFIFELLIVLICCRPVIVPTPRPSGGIARSL